MDVAVHSLDILKQNALQEANLLAITPELLSGRAPRASYTFDSADTKVRDDAFSITYDDQGAPTLHASAVDIAAFIPPDSALEQLAFNRCLDENPKTKNIWPPKVTRKLSLMEGVECPVITAHMPFTVNGLGRVSLSRERLHVIRSLSHQEVKAEMQRGDTDGIFADFYALSDRIQRLRYKQAGKEFTKSPASSFEEIITSFAQQAVAQYMREHDVPGFFRIVSAQTSKQPRASQILLKPETHGPSYEARALWTSPLRKYIDYANHQNLAASLDEQPYPFPDSQLKKVMHFIVWKEKQPYYTQAVDIKRSLETLTQIPAKSDRDLENLRNRLVRAIFGQMTGSEEEIRATRHLAAKIAAMYPDDVGAILLTARQRGLFKLENIPGSKQQILITPAGERFPYPRNTGPRAPLKYRKIRFINNFVGYDPAVE